MLKNYSDIARWFSSASRKKIVVITFFTVLLLFFAGKYLFNKKDPVSAPPNKIVEVELLEKQHFQQKIRLLGTVHPKHRTMMVAQGSGTLYALVPTGQHVKKGVLIAKIDNPDLEKNYQLSLGTESTLKAQFERLDPLLKKGYMTTAELETKKQDWVNAQKTVSTSKMALDNLRFYAPFDGIVGVYKKREGAQINQGDSVVAMYDPATLMVDFDIPCSNLGAISHDQAVYVFGKRHTIASLQKMLDEDTHMCPADVEIHCEDCLIGSTVDVDLVVSEKKEAITIPFQALFLKNRNPFVYIVSEDKIVLMPVKTGIKQEDRIEITEGLNAGEQLVIKGQERLSPEMSVSIYKNPIS